MKHGSLFSGIGGFDLAAERTGWDNVFHCEISEFPRKILNYYWPNSISYDNICTTDFTIHRGQVDIISGGFPCQPFSTAGAMAGTEDTRYLWPQMLRVIREVRPRWVVGENVHGLVSWNEGMVFDTVCADLENEGFKVIPVILPAASINAPHKRNRVFFIAHTNDKGGRSEFGSVQKENGEVSQWNNDAKLSNADDVNATNSDSIRLEQRKDGTEVGGGQTEMERQRSITTDAFKTDGEVQYTSNSDSKMLEHGNGKGETFGRANKEKRIKSLDGARGWETFPTQSPICSGDDGLSSRLDSITFPKWRKESIKGYGNAVVPDLVAMIFKTIQEYENKFL